MSWWLLLLLACGAKDEDDDDDDDDVGDSGVADSGVADGGAADGGAADGGAADGGSGDGGSGDGGSGDGGADGGSGDGGADGGAADGGSGDGGSGDGGSGDGGASLTWYLDADEDGYGAGEGVLAAVAPPGHVADAGDCDDADPAVHPGAAEVCNEGQDDDCDGLVDDLDPGLEGAPTWHRDADLDGYGDEAAAGARCTQPEGYVALDGDCDDGDAAVHPGATEVCNEGQDDDCDGLADDADPDLDTSDLSRWWRDLDGDGYGGSAEWTEACAAPEGYAASSEDCDDALDSVHPAAEEVCGNGLDDDCDGGSGDCGLGGAHTLSTAGSAAKLMGPGAATYLGIGGALEVADLDADGWPDVVVGAYQDDSGVTNGGGAYVVAGPPEGRIPLATAETVILGDTTNSYLGYDLDVGSDVDGDGTLDLVLASTDTVRVWLGPVSGAYGPDDADLAVVLDEAWTAVLVATGDTDGDGIGEVAAAPGSSGAEGAPVRVWAGPLVEGSLPIELSGSDIGETLVMGDLDGDGLDDLATSHAETDGDGHQLSLYTGPLDADAEVADADAALVGCDADMQPSVLLVADLDADGTGDLVVGNQYESLGGSSMGAVRVYAGALAGRFTPDDAAAVRYGVTSTLENFGTDLAAGDLDGDGVGDLVVGARELSMGNGTAWIFLGPLAGTDTTADAWGAHEGEEYGDRAGEAVAAGDLDGDGWPELLVAVPLDAGGGEGAGAVHVVAGGGL